MVDLESTPIFLPWWRQSKKIIPVAVLALLLVPAVILVGIRQLTPKASNAISVQVSPGAIDQSASPQIGKPVYLSATAVDEVGRPITTGVSYTWGISSNFPISPTFKPSNNLATFTPNSTGSGSLWVSAITSESSAIKYIDVCVGVLCPSYTNPTPTPTPTPTSTPVPVSFTGLSASLPGTGSAVFHFTYSGSSPSFAIDISTKSDMSTDVYSTFTWGTSSPLVENNPTKWDKYSCGRTLYWIVKTPSGDKSKIVPSVVTCPTPTSTPTPIPNYTPTITTTYLISARVGDIYNVPVEGEDLDANDTLSMTISNLPPGLVPGVCTQLATSISPHRIVCSINGSPTQSGTYQVTIVLTDNHGGKDSKTLPLTISPFFTPTPKPTPTPIPTPTPTLTPTPVPNRAPTIVTQSLPIGRVARAYSASVAATDPDPYDNLTAQITGLPPLLKVVGCIQSSSTPNSDSSVQPPTIRNLVCTISGTPYSFGIFPVKITVTDSANTSAVKTVNLFIVKKYILF